MKQFYLDSVTMPSTLHCYFTFINILLFLTSFIWPQMVSSSRFMQFMTAVKGCEYEIMWSQSDTFNFSCHFPSTAEMSVAVERIFTQCMITKHCSLCPAVTLNCIFFNGCMNLLQRAKETVDGEKQSEHVWKCNTQQSLVYFLSKSSCLLLMTEVSIKTIYYHKSYSSYCKWNEIWIWT